MSAARWSASKAPETMPAFPSMPTWRIVDESGTLIAHAFSEDAARVIVAAAHLHAAVAALVDVLERCDADTKPNDLADCTDDEWDQALALGRAALAKVQS